MCSLCDGGVCLCRHALDACTISDRRPHRPLAEGISDGFGRRHARATRIREDRRSQRCRSVEARRAAHALLSSVQLALGVCVSCPRSHRCTRSLHAMAWDAMNLNK
eukprot:7383517-Prymnesium_polylepis.1